MIFGIDTGVQTGIAAWQQDEKRLTIVTTVSIDVALTTVGIYAKRAREVGLEILVRVEDARQAIYGRRMQGHRMRGAGSVMRDAKIWEDFLTREHIPFEMLRPRKEFTKWKPEPFKRLTGWLKRTSQHGRDAALLCYGY